MLGEPEEMVRRKLLRALAAGLQPVLCVGETLAERDAGRTFGVLRWQLLHALEGLDTAELERVVLAYEPVWAIGTGEVPELAEIEDALGSLRDHVARGWGEAAARRMRLLYGGSVGEHNAAQLLGVPGCDGVLVGGASLELERFGRILEAALTVRRSAH
ncbi:MAG: hypothetical protein KatS3mg102_1380 [Planctomycetota bacterium]|nr:MAG: hypothetical protein KatS3mg102_1380 [Planctomycetota bacterium]